MATHDSVVTLTFDDGQPPADTDNILAVLRAGGRAALVPVALYQLLRSTWAHHPLYTERIVMPR
jgi:hypothetical protein